MSTPEPTPAKKKRRVILCGVLCGVLCVLGAYLLYTAARTTVLLGNAKELIADAEKFPREYSLGASGGRELIYVVLGDSTAVGVGAARLEGSYAFQIATKAAAHGRRVQVINIAASGARLRDVLKNQMPQLEKLKPHLISLSIGANDATHFSSTAQYQKEVGILVSQLNRQTAVVLLASAPDMVQAPALPLPLALAVNRRAMTQNKILQSALGNSKPHNSKLRYVDLFHRGKLIYSKNPDLYATDFFHPSADGYAIWADLFVQAMTDASSLKSTP